jgi:hypothetical protein
VEGAGEAAARDVATIRADLEARVARREIVTYAPVMDLLGLSPAVAADRGRIGAVLVGVSLDSFREHGRMLSVLVHRKGKPPTRPGAGFFKLAAELGLLTGDPDRFVADELERVWTLYGGLPPPFGPGPDRLL